MIISEFKRPIISNKQIINKMPIFRESLTILKLNICVYLTYAPTYVKQSIS